MGAVHIFTVKTQPATGYTDDNGDIPFSGGWPAHALLVCHCCCKPRRAKNVVVQCFYDGPNFWCAPDKGCMSPKMLAAKRRLAFRNRSAGQRARWGKATG